MEDQSQQPEPATALRERIAACRTLQELKTLLLAKEVILDELLLAAFDQRIEALEEQTGQPFLSNL